MPSTGGVIAFVHVADEWYGADYVLFELVRALEGTEFTPVVILPDDVASEIAPEHRLSGRLRAAGITVHHLPIAVLRRRYMTPTGIVTLMLRARAARRRVIACLAGSPVVMMHTHTAGVVTGASVARALAVPHLWHVSEIVTRPRIVGKWLARLINRRSDRIITVSNAVRDHLIASQPAAAQKTRVIYNAVDPRRFDGVHAGAMRARFAPGGEPVVGMIGRVGMQKGQELLLDAMRAVVKEMPGVRLALVGGVLNGNLATLEALRTLAADYGLSNHVVIDGYCSDVPACLGAMDIVVQPSLRPDSLPTTVLEAMASGKPVIAAANGGSPEMIVPEETGLLVPTGDARALAAAILRLLRDVALRERMGRAGRARVERTFAPEQFRAAYLSEYRALCAPLREPATTRSHRDPQ